MGTEESEPPSAHAPGPEGPDVVSSNPEALAASARGLAARLALSRPLVFMDLETTGLSTQEDRIAQMAVVKLWPGGEFMSHSTLVDPGVPIPPGATAVHGIGDEQVAGQPRFAALAPQLAAYLDGCDFAGFGVARFDLPLLLAEFRRAGCEFSLEGRRVLDALAIFHQREPRTLEAALRFYRGRELEGAHDALADVEASLEVLEGQFGHYGDLPTDLAELTDIAMPGWFDAEGVLVWREGELHFGRGKHRGASVASVVERDPTYVDWMLRDTFAPEVKSALIQIRSGGAPDQGR